jgi:hypothetical protein
MNRTEERVHKQALFLWPVIMSVKVDGTLFSPLLQISWQLRFTIWTHGMECKAVIRYLLRLIGVKRTCVQGNCSVALPCKYASCSNDSLC